MRKSSPQLVFYNLQPSSRAALSPSGESEGCCGCCGIFFSTTRHGGQSKGEYSSFNINEYCGDAPADIAANRRLLCNELGIDEAHLVMPHQTHGVVVRQIAEDFVHLPENIRKMIL